MKTDNKTAAYAAMAVEAEAAVAAVKDPELRRVAFEKILATMIEGGSNSSRGKRENEESRRGPAGAAKGTKSRTKKGPKGYVEELLAEDFFKTPRTIAKVKAELANGGHHIPLTSLSGPLQALTRKKKLRRQKLSGDGKHTKASYGYSNW